MNMPPASPNPYDPGASCLTGQTPCRDESRPSAGVRRVSTRYLRSVLGSVWHRRSAYARSFQNGTVLVPSSVSAALGLCGLLTIFREGDGRRYVPLLRGPEVVNRAPETPTGAIVIAKRANQKRVLRRVRSNSKGISVLFMEQGRRQQKPGRLD
jgi:hypothetical protein